MARLTAGLARQAEFRQQIASKSPWEMSKRELKIERERLEKAESQNYARFAYSTSSQRGYSAETAARLAQVKAAMGEKIYPWQWTKERAQRKGMPAAKHEEAIKKAIEQGLPVPEDVRAEYEQAQKAKPSKPAKASSKRNKPVKQQLSDILKNEAGFDIAGHERQGKEKARGEIHLNWHDLDAKQQAAIKDIEKNGLGFVSDNGGFGVVIRPMWPSKPSEGTIEYKNTDLFTLTYETRPFDHGMNARKFYLFRFKEQPSEKTKKVLTSYGYKQSVDNIWVAPAVGYASKGARELSKRIGGAHEPNEEIPF